MYKLFLIEQTGRVQFYACVIEKGECQIGFDYHRGTVTFAEAEIPIGTAPDIPSGGWDAKILNCDKCGKLLQISEPSSLGSRREWIRKETGEKHFEVREFGVGACFYVSYLENYMHSIWDNWRGGPPIEIVMPNNDSWMPESRARNCTLPEDKLHRCWCLHGDFPNWTADKNGLTCNAGAGSIATRNWHGFLRNGELAP